MPSPTLPTGPFAGLPFAQVAARPRGLWALRWYAAQMARSPRPNDPLPALRRFLENMQ